MRSWGRRPSGWTGGARDSQTEGHAATGGHEARSRRDLLLPALHALQDRIGQITQPGLNYVCRRLSVPPAEAYGVATFYALFATKPRPPAVAHVCDDIACRLAGAEDVFADVERALGPAGSAARDGRIGGCAARASGCASWRPPRRCSRSPAKTPFGRSRRRSTRPGSWPGSKGPRAPLAGAAHGARAQAQRSARRRELRATGGRGAAPAARVASEWSTPLRSTTTWPARLSRAPTRARDGRRGGHRRGHRRRGCVGRGGAAFPTGRKWAAVAAQPAQPHYVVCNADESEPGTFKDRVLMEVDPFAVVEAMTIEGFATGASQGFLYIRGEYPLAERAHPGRRSTPRAPRATSARTSLGSGFAFDIEVRRGAGAYICGEETALFESIEGKRGEPRNKPPFPVEVGLFGKPTAVNNVETLANVLAILEDGAGGARFAAIGTEGSTGPKLFCLSGQRRQARASTRCRSGRTLGELLELAGGVPGRSVDPGDPARRRGGRLRRPGRARHAAHLRGHARDRRDPRLGRGHGLRRDARTWSARSGGSPRSSATSRAASASPAASGRCARRSCSRASPTGSAVRRRDEELVLLAEIGQAMRDAIICGLGQTASSAIESALRQPELVAL